METETIVTLITCITTDKDIRIEDFLGINDKDRREFFTFLITRFDDNFKFFKTMYDYYMNNLETLNDETAINLGYMHYFGKGVEKNYDEALKYFKMCQNETGDNLNIIGVIYRTHEYAQRNYAKAMNYFARALKYDNYNAMHNLGVMYLHGFGCEINVDTAMKYFKKSKQFVVSSLMCIGLTYYHGTLIERNYKKAFKYFKLAGEKGHPHALHNVSAMYYNGHGVEQNYEEAFRYEKLALHYGHIPSLYSIGTMYHAGKGVEKNYGEAIKYYIMAIENKKDYVIAKLNLALLIDDINQCPNAEKIKYYNILIQHETTKEYAKHIVIKQKTEDIVHMYNMIEKLKKRLEKLESLVQYVPDGYN